MNSIFRFQVLVLTLLFTACAPPATLLNSTESTGRIHGEAGMYPELKYLSATGSAANAEQAKARALANLAKIFEVQIREVSTTSQAVQTSKKSGIEVVEKNARIASTVNVKTDKMLQGARIAEQWQNNTDLSYHALAVLDRMHAGNNIRSEMKRLDEETQYILNQQTKRSDILLRISDLHSAHELQQDRKALQETLKIIDVNGIGAPAQWSLADLNERLQHSLRSLPLQTTVNIDDVGGLNNILQGAASVSGFIIGNAGDPDRAYKLAASLEAFQPFLKDGWYWLRATLKLELIAQDGFTVIGYHSWPLKVSASNLEQLPVRMRKAADKKLQQELLSSILEFAT